MHKLKLSILTNMVTPYRVSLFRAMASDNRIKELRILTCTERESDRKWDVRNDASYKVKILSGMTIDLKRGSNARRILHFRFGIFAELALHRPDRLVIGDASWTSYLAVIACKLLRIRYLAWNEITSTTKVSTGLVAYLRRMMYHHAYHLIASCEMAKDFLLSNDVPEEKISIVLNAVDNDFFLEQRRLWEPQRFRIRADLGVAENAFCFIYVGQLISRKRVLETVRLLARTSKEKQIHFLIAGSGPLEGAMRTAAEEMEMSAITFCGHANSERLAQLYTASDALILLSDDEPWGMVVNEATLFGLKIYTTRNVAAAVELSKIADNLTRFVEDGISASRFIDEYKSADRTSFAFGSQNLSAGNFINAI